ncbi:hypothetical protein SMKI_04G6570 [Saccharomyces mikatae IFO 1815]|uniref:Uncharacterized protein n=1 Tax=Saccharomyces mikatae IFO 1815 TaxID=226126 RepID=A0AA35NG25_SACMI|nr:uncharacterized protein SMKI_04G6570 [Saccharomyces mikatae IFO 1815]CAI4038314.1 hypothetical protein SMKI_04G6570 [Saccharomyces mikatae IFO 1815]
MDSGHSGENKKAYKEMATPLPADPPSYEETMKNDKEEVEADKAGPSDHGDSFVRPVYTHHPHPRSHKGYPGAQTLTYASR